MRAAEVRLANETWEAMFRAQATLAQEFEYTGDWGQVLPREYGVLYALAGAPEGVRMTALCDDVLLTQAGISRLVDRLERRGLVERRPDPDDARATRVLLTEKGAAVQVSSGRMHATQVAQAMLRALDADELAELGRLSRKLLAAAEATGSQASEETERTES
jgi:DNA-binding MarR family transcriptional regulator